MANDSRTITIDLKVLTDKLTSGFQKGTAATKAWGAETQGTIAAVEGSTERISRLWRSAFEAFLGFEAVNMLKKIALGAADAAEELAVAARVAANFGHSLDPGAMEHWLEAFSRSAAGGGYAIDEMRASVQQFAALGLDAAQTQRAIADTANLAAARNMDFAQATTIVRQALTGHVAMLTRYGVISVEAAKNIKTVEQAMEALEKATAGAAGERANTLPGAFGRLATSASLLRDAFGAGLIPMFTALSNALTNIANAVAKIPAPILNAVASIVGVTAALAATALFLPAIWKGITIIGEGFRLVWVFASPLVGVLKGVGEAFLLVRDGALAAAAGELLAAAAPALIIAAVSALIVVLVELIRHFGDTKKLFADLIQLMVDKWRAFVSDVSSTFAPLIDFFSKLFSALSSLWVKFAKGLSDLWGRFVDWFHTATKGVIDAFGALVSSLKPVADAWDSFCDYLDKRFGNFVDHLGEKVKTAIGYLDAMSLGGAIAGPIGAIVALPFGSKSKATSADQGKVAGDAMKLFRDGIGDWKQLTASLGNLFKSSLGKTPPIPGEAFTGNIPGRGGKDTSAQQAENAMKNFLDGIKQALAAYESRTADAKHGVEKATTAVDLYKAALPGGEPQNEQQAAELQKLISNELRAQQTLHDRLVEQQRAELLAQESLEKAAARISPHLKNHDELVRQARDAALQHLRAAQALGEQYLRIGVTVAQLKNTMREAFEKGLSNEAQSQIDALEGALAMRKIGYDTQQEAVTAQLDQMRVTKGSKPVEEDRLKIQLAQLALQLAEDTEAVKQHALGLRQDEFNRDQSTENATRLAQAQQAEAQATLDVVRAQNALNLASDQLIVDQKQKWDDFINTLVQKANVPGLSGSAQAGFSFNPLGLLMAAIEKTQVFADVINTVTSIVNTFALALNAFRPIIDALLQVVRAVANVFIFMYNAVARILDLFGLQIRQLQYLTDAMQGLIPLISIWHEIPTLNELAAGRLNSPLSPIPQGYNNIGQTQGGQNTLMRVVEILTGILVAIVIEKMISGMSLMQATQSALHLMGINIGQKIQTNLSATEAAKATALQTVLAGKATALQTALGAKAAALTQTTNSILLQMETTLTAILAALNAQASGGVFGAIFKIGAGAGGAGALAGPMAGPLTQMSQVIRSVGDGMRNALDSVTQHSRALDRAAASALRLGDAFDRLTSSTSRMALSGGGSIASLSTTIALDTSRRSGAAAYGMDRF